MKRLLLLLLLLPAVCATTIYNSENTATIEEGIATIEQELSLQSKIEGDLVFKIPSDAYDFKINIDGEQKNCTIQEKEDEKLARCGTTKNGTQIVRMSYKTAELLGQLGDQTIIKYTDKLPYKTERYTFTLRLPEGYIIPKDNKRDFYLSPEPDSILSDGQRILILWETEDITRFSATAIIEQLEQASNIMMMVAIALITFLITITGMLGVGYFRSKKSKETPKEVVPGFIESEQKVIDLLKQAETRTLWQKQIQTETGFSKAKLSRIIRNLEARGVIMKEAYGNTNKIILKQNGNSIDDKNNKEQET